MAVQTRRSADRRTRSVCDDRRPGGINKVAPRSRRSKAQATSATRYTVTVAGVAAAVTVGFSFPTLSALALNRPALTQARPHPLRPLTSATTYRPPAPHSKAA